MLWPAAAESVLHQPAACFCFMWLAAGACARGLSSVRARQPSPTWSAAVGHVVQLCVVARCTSKACAAVCALIPQPEPPPAG